MDANLIQIPLRLDIYIAFSFLNNITLHEVFVLFYEFAVTILG